ncbi:MAG: acyl transferase, partial [Panacibacter sp.]
MQHEPIVNNIFDTQPDFSGKAMKVLLYQYANNAVYRQWNDFLNIDIASVSSLNAIPFLPISFFKTHKVVCGDFIADHIFESSGTTQSATSRHYVKKGAIYTESFFKAFEIFYGAAKDWCIIGLLPSYLERKNSSLILMVDELIKASYHLKSGFYLDDFEKLYNVLQLLESRQQKTLLIGVTFALLDFAEQYP